MTNDEICNLIATLERESDRRLEKYRNRMADGKMEQARYHYGVSGGLQYAIGALEACIRDK